MRALYISQTGMLEGLGKSQVLPYVRGLARRGIEFDLVSFELPDAERDQVEALRAGLASQGIRWQPLQRARDPRLVVKLRESAHGMARALASALTRRPDIVHGRSYFATAVADAVATTVPGAKLLFDCRGMIADEYVDASYWTPDRLEYRMVKRYEARALRRAEGIVFLTRALHRWMQEQRLLGAGTEVATIPCCVDLDEFRFDAAARSELRKELRLEGATALVYAGSLGSWYREDEIARFAGIVRRRSANPVRFLLLTRSNPDELVPKLRAEGFGDDAIAVVRANPTEMPRYLSAGDVGISFIKSCFSKKGSSPTKVAEYLACGLPVVLNGDIGDQADLASSREACVVLGTYAEEELARAADRVLAMANAPLEQRVEAGRRVAEEHFGLERVGVARYERLYRAIARAGSRQRQRLENHGAGG